MDKNLQALTKAINSTEKLNGEQFNKHPDALHAYEVVFGKKELEETLASKKDLAYNAFYHVSGCFKRQIKSRALPTKTAKFYIDQIIHTSIKNHLLLDLMSNALERNEVDEAISLMDDLVVKQYDIKYHGYRILLVYYATIGDLGEFKKYLKLSQPAKSPRQAIVSAKFIFISNYADKKGIKKAIELLKDKVFGEKLCLATIENHAHKFTLRQINNVLKKYPLFKENDEFCKPWLFVKHFSNQSPVTIDDKEFEITLAEILKVDKDLKRGDGRFRDYLLYDLAGSVTQLEQIKTCKKHIIAPFYKRELNYHIKNVKEKNLRQQLNTQA